MVSTALDTRLRSTASPGALRATCWWSVPTRNVEATGTSAPKPINQPMDDASQLPVRVAQAVSFVVTGVNGGTLVVLNSPGVWLIKGVVGLAYTYLIALYWVILPFVPWTAILPTTRGVLVGWFRSYISIAFRPMFWGIADQINIALFQTAGFGSKGVAGSSDLVSVTLHLGQSQVMFLHVQHRDPVRLRDRDPGHHLEDRLWIVAAGLVTRRVRSR
jgi:hypothetical protein